MCKPALEHPRGEHIQSKSRDEACYSIDEVVRLNIDRSTAEQHVERQEASKKPAAATPGHNHQDGRHTDMRRREGGRRTLTHLLRTLHQIIEETMLVARPRQQLLIVIEVVADGGKDTVQHVLHADGRPCYCGRRGCADAYLSAKRLAEISESDVSEFFKRLGRGEKREEAAWKTYRKDLALLISNIRVTLDCNLILGGDVGGFLGEKYERSKLYDPTFTHGYREASR